MERYLKNDKPFTLEELREMDGQPVWCEEEKSFGIIQVDKTGQWENVPFIATFHNGAHFVLNIESRQLHCY
jgi:hypothetical protein